MKRSTGDNPGPDEVVERAAGVILGGPTIRLTVEMQIRDKAAHWQHVIRLAPGSNEVAAKVAADEVEKAVKELALFLALDRVEHG